MTKRNKNKRYIVLAVVLVIAILLGITVKDVKENHRLNFFEKAIKSPWYINIICEKFHKQGKNR